MIKNWTADFLMFASDNNSNSIKVKVVDENSVCQDFRHTGDDGKNYDTKINKKAKF